MSRLLKTLIFDNQLSLAVLDTTDMVNEAIKKHKLSPVSAAALGRTLTACTFMASGLKNESDNLSVTVAGDGPLGKITVCGNKKLQMRGSVDNPSLDLPLKSNGKLDVGGAVGKGRLTIVKSMGLKEPYSGSSELVSGEIAEDFTAYYAYSEQQPTAMCLGVKIGKNLKCVGAGGVIIQALPFASQENLIKAENIIYMIGDEISTIIECDGIDEMIRKLFPEYKFEEYNPEYKCLCSKKKTENMLRSLGKKELDDIIKEQNEIRVSCQFCNKEYIFNKQDVDKLFEKNGR